VELDEELEVSPGEVGEVDVVWAPAAALAAKVTIAMGSR
jgi:hypothetical protein